MIIDERTEFADNASIVGATGTALVGDVIDLEVVRDIGNGQPVYLIITVQTEVDSAADTAVVEFVLASDAQAAIATDGTATEHASTGQIDQAALTAGKTFVITAGIEGPLYERYLGLLVRRTGEATTAGAINAFLSLDPHAWRAYADAVN